jgi:cytochrome P450
MAPPGPHGRANAGYLRRLFSDPAPALDALHAQFGPICGLGYPGVRLAIIGDPALMHEIFAMKADAFRWNHKFNVVGVRFVVGTQSMIVSDGADHQRRRGAVQRAFTRPRLNGWIPMILQRADTAIDELLAAPRNVERPVDLYPVGRDLILGITLHAFFGERLARRTAER